jgi:hypothetical protein
MFKKLVLISMVLVFSSICLGEDYISPFSEERIKGHVYSEKNEGTMYMGVLTGRNAPINAVTPSTELGLTLGYQPEGSFGLGLEVSTSRLADFYNRQRTSVIAQTAYKLGGDIIFLKSSYIGIGIGTAFVNTNVSWEASPLLGFDVPLSNKVRDVISFGFNVRYVALTDSVNSYVSNAVLKYWY